MKNKKGKQFRPFDALKGFRQALHEQELEKVEKPLLSIEQEQRINATLQRLKEQDVVNIQYYDQNQIITMKNEKIDKINFYEYYLMIHQRKIYFNQLLDIQQCSNLLDDFENF